VQVLKVRVAEDVVELPVSQPERLLELVERLVHPPQQRQAAGEVVVGYRVCGLEACQLLVNLQAVLVAPGARVGVAQLEKHVEVVFIALESGFQNPQLELIRYLVEALLEILSLVLVFFRVHYSSLITVSS
jgi:hypothetical protein